MQSCVGVLMRHISARLVHTTIYLSTLLILITNLSFAQVTVLDAGVRPDSIYAGDHEAISLGSGNLSLQIPLFHIPGRGGVDHTLTLSYNSNFWYHVDTEYNGTYATEWQTVSPPSLDHAAAPGWLLLDSAQVGFTGNQPDCNGVGCTTNIYCARNYHAVTESGNVLNFPNVLTNCYQVGENGVETPEPTYNVYTDGDSLGDAINAQTGVVTRIDGSRITYVPTNPTSLTIEDRNGNIHASPITYTWDSTNTNLSVTDIDDTGSQSVTITYGPAPSGTQPLSFPCNAYTITDISIPKGTGQKTIQSITLPITHSTRFNMMITARLPKLRIRPEDTPVTTGRLSANRQVMLTAGLRIDLLRRNIPAVYQLVIAQARRR
jgi:hypothetical protein